ncbi:hypothetical protein AZZ95_002037, partial [Enterobacter roggenkampii]
ESNSLFYFVLRKCYRLCLYCVTYRALVY